MTEPNSKMLEDLMAENARLKAAQAPPVAGSLTKFYIGASICLCLLTVVGIVVLVVARPDKDNTATIATIIGLVSPILASLGFLIMNQNHMALNGRMTQLLTATDASAEARGTLAEKVRTEGAVVAAVTAVARDVAAEARGALAEKERAEAVHVAAAPVAVIAQVTLKEGEKP